MRTLIFLLIIGSALSGSFALAIGSNDNLPLLGSGEVVTAPPTMVAALPPASVFLGRASDESESAVAEKPSQFLQAEIQKRYPKHRIEIHTITWMTGSSPQGIESVRIIEDRPGGEVRFEATGVYQGIRGSIQGFAKYSAMFSVPLAKQRFSPGERLQPAQFEMAEIDVASGINREYRGLILSTLEELNGKEAKQTILEGAYVLSTAVQKVPDVRRGDVVSLRLQSGDIILTAPAIAQENGFLNQSVRVLTTKTKRELQGKVALNGIVEVKL